MLFELDQAGMRVHEFKAVVVILNAFGAVIARHVYENAESRNFIGPEKVAGLAAKENFTLN